MAMHRFFRILWPACLAVLLFGGGFAFWAMGGVNDYIDACLDDYSPQYIHDQTIRDTACDGAQMRVTAPLP